MIRPFRFATLPAIWFGTGRLSLLPGIVKGMGNSLLLVTGERSFAASCYARELFEGFRKKNLQFHQVSISGEPTVEMIDQAVERFRTVPVQVVVAIGGGSVIDAGKAISAMLTRDESVEVFLEGVGNQEHPGSKIPFIAVPTTAGTGSEATKNAVIARVGPDGFKRSLRHDHFVPDIALIDPELYLGCPEKVAVASGMDCFVQLTEAFLSTGANPYTDALALEGLNAIKRSLTAFLTDRNDLNAATDMAFAALTSGICLANAGLGVIHGFAASVGGMFDIPHGVICGSLMAAANEINVRELRRTGNNPDALKKYAVLGRLFLETAHETDDYYVDGFIMFLRQLSAEFPLAGFSNFGVKSQDTEKICSLTAAKSNPVGLSPGDLMEILSSRLF